MTIASAQGLTVDRAFLLVDERPARETIYPAATHGIARRLDIYVNRSAARLRHRRAPTRGRGGPMPVTGQRTCARIWPSAGRARSPRRPRSITSPTARGGMHERTQAASGRRRDWRSQRRCRRRSDGSARGPRGCQRQLRCERIARDIRHAVNGWRLWCGGGRVRGRARRGHGGLGRAARPRPGRGRCRSRSAPPSARPSTGTAP